MEAHIALESINFLLPFLFVFMAIVLILSILQIAATWKLYTLANKPGWAAIVPFYNYVVMLEIVGKPLWWILLYLIPLVNIVFYIWTLNLFVKAFGKESGYTVLVVLFPYIFLPLLAFSKDTRFTGKTSNPESFSTLDQV